jgi:hypothetical protein
MAHYTVKNEEELEEKLATVPNNAIITVLRTNKKYKIKYNNAGNRNVEPVTNKSYIIPQKYVSRLTGTRKHINKYHRGSLKNIKEHHKSTRRFKFNSLSASLMHPSVPSYINKYKSIHNSLRSLKHIPIKRKYTITKSVSSPHIKYGSYVAYLEKKAKQLRSTLKSRKN